MGQRSRKRGRREPRPGQTRTRASEHSARTPVGAAADRSTGAGTRRRLSSEERNAAVRAGLAPLAPGERPWAVKVSVAIALLLGLANVVLFVAGVKPRVGGTHPHLFEILVFSGLMLMCAVGMWTMRYWAVLGFQTLLAIGVLGFSLALVKASTVFGALLCVVVIGGGGFLFVKLVRVLSRLQLPTPPGR